MGLAWQSTDASANPRRTVRHPRVTPAVSKPMEAYTMNLKPLDDRIVVRPNEAETQTASGLVIPDTAKEKPQQGEVLAVGPGKRSETSGEVIPVDINVGDTVLYSKYGGTEVAANGEDLLVLNSRDVLAIVES